MDAGNVCKSKQQIRWIALRNCFWGLLCVALIGCGGDSQSAAPNDVVAFPGADVQTPTAPISGSPVAEQPTVPSTLPSLVANKNVSPAVVSERQFAAEFYREMRKTNAGNLVTSPYSLYLSLAMISAGAARNTLAELSRALGAGPTAAEFHRTMSTLRSALAARGAGLPLQQREAFTIKVANSAWLQLGTHFGSNFLDTLSNDYVVSPALVDMTSGPAAEQSRLLINQSISDQTNGHITDSLPAQALDNAEVALVSVAYLDAEWLYRFIVADTTIEPFYADAATSSMVATMHKQARLNFMAGSQFQAVELPYIDQELAMWLVLPSSGSDVDDAGIVTEFLQADSSVSVQRPVAMTVPKLKFDSTTILNDVLRGMGIRDVFDDERADFTPVVSNVLDVSNPKLSVAGVFQKSFIELNERGTIAGAATTIVVGGTISPTLSTEIAIEFNRPFLFFIVDRTTQAVLFVGRVYSP